MDANIDCDSTRRRFSRVSPGSWPGVDQVAIELSDRGLCHAYPSLPPLYNDVSVRPRADTSPAPTQEVLPSWKASGAYKQFSELLAKDKARNLLTPGGLELLETLLNPDDSTGTKVHVMSFNVNGDKADDIFYVWRHSREPGKSNFLVYMPDNHNKSFHEFKSPKEFRKFFKELPSKPEAFKAFLSHFGKETGPQAVERVKHSIESWVSSPGGVQPITKVGGVGHLHGNVFEHLEKWSKNSSALLPGNGLSDIQIKSVNPQGVATFIGTRPSGESVLYQYDPKGNLIGSDDKGNYYFMTNALFSDKPLLPLTYADFKSLFITFMLDSISEAAEDLGDAIANFLEHPFSGLSSLLQALGVDKSIADKTEESFDNPVTSLLLHLNKYNHIGKVFGISKKEMDQSLTNFGDKAQGAVPVYGQVRSLGALIGKAIKNEPLTDSEIREASDALELKH